MKWKKLILKNDLTKEGRFRSSTTIVGDGSNSYAPRSVYVVGGRNGINNWGVNVKNILVFNFDKVNLFWLLHFLDLTGIQREVGFNMIQEIAEMLELAEFEKYWKNKY